MGRRSREESSGIDFPFDDKKSAKPVIECPECGNDGMDGSITGKSGQWGIKRLCKKCGHSWSGGIAVQKADFSEPLPIPGIDTTGDDRPDVQYTGPAFRDPNKNYDPGEG